MIGIAHPGLNDVDSEIFPPTNRQEATAGVNRDVGRDNGLSHLRS